MSNIIKPTPLNFLNKTRIIASEILDDTLIYLQRVYKNSSNLLTSASPFRQIIQVFSELFELNMFYIEDVALEQNILTATNTESIYGHAVLAGHNPTRAVSSISEIRFKFRPGKESEINGGYILIPNNLNLLCKTNNLNYILRSNTNYIKVNKNSTDFINVQLIEGKLGNDTVRGTGETIQTFNIKPKGDVEHNNVKVFVNSELWTPVKSIYDMRKNQNSYLVRTGMLGGIDIIFGNGNFGRIPTLGSIIKVEYIETMGSLGNIIGESNSIEYQFLDDGLDSSGEIIDLNEFLLIESVSSPKFGTDAENTEFTKIIAPLASKSFVLIGPENYQYFLSRYNNLSYIEAYNTYDDEYLDDDNVIYLFLLPNIKPRLNSGKDYFNIDEKYFRLTSEEKTMIHSVLNESGQEGLTTEINIIDPIITKYSASIVLRYFEGYNKETIKNEIRSKLNEYFTNVIRRDKIPKSDIISIIENITGIDSVNVIFTSQKNEEAILNGFYYTETTKITPTTPFMQEGEDNKKRYVFFDKEIIKTKIILNNNEDPQLGLDEFGDINIGKNELPILRGGWNDRNNHYYEEYPDDTKLSGLNIYFKESIPESIGSKISNQNKQLL